MNARLRRLQDAADDLDFPLDAERKGKRRRFHEAVLDLGAGELDEAWDLDILTVERYRQAQQIQREKQFA